VADRVRVTWIAMVKGRIVWLKRQADSQNFLSSKLELMLS
jgi:hypothetical protein